MRIGGLLQFSLSDFPGRVAAVIFTQGCNFRCPFCHNGSLLSRDGHPEQRTPSEEVLRFLEVRSDKLDGVVLSGGEPTLQTDLPAFLRQVKELGLATKLDTNGTRPDVLAGLIREELLDCIAMDVKAPLEIYHRLTGVPVPTGGIRESIELIAASGVAHEFRTTVVEQLLSPRDLSKIQALVPPGSRHKWQPFRPENALDPSLRIRTATSPREEAPLYQLTMPAHELASFATSRPGDHF